MRLAAQDRLEEAREILRWQREMRGDSIYVRFDDAMRKVVSAERLNTTWPQLEKQMGKFVGTGEWRQMREEGVVVCFTEVWFERAALRFLVAFDGEGRVNTLRWLHLRSESVAFDSARLEERPLVVKSGLLQMPGTITLPQGESNLPVVVLLHGSGPQDRDGTLGPNKIYRDMAWGLAEEGIAVIRYDKRTRVYGNNCVPLGGKLTPEVEVVEDALSAVRLAKTLPEADTSRIFVVGHSLGAMLAPLVAFRCGSLAGIALLAPGARQLEDMAEEQLRYVASLGDEMTEEEIQRQLQLLLSAAPKEYWEYLRRYNPVTTAAALEIPILVMQGERDYQVTMRDFSLWQKGLAGKSAVAFKSYPLLNHFFMKGEGKITPAEYFRPARVDGSVIKDLSVWIKSH